MWPMGAAEQAAAESAEQPEDLKPGHGAALHLLLQLQQQDMCCNCNQIVANSLLLL